MAFTCVNGARECNGCGDCQSDKEKQIYTECEECGNYIYDGEEFYIIDFKNLCKDCANDKYMHVAGDY